MAILGLVWFLGLGVLHVDVTWRVERSDAGVSSPPARHTLSRDDQLLTDGDQVDVRELIRCPTSTQRSPNFSAISDTGVTWLDCTKRGVCADTECLVRLAKSNAGCQE